MRLAAEPKDPNLCAGPGCTRKAAYAGLCQSHYRQKTRGRELKPLRNLSKETVQLTHGSRVSPEIFAAMEEAAKAQGISLYELQNRINEAWYANWKAGLRK